MPAPLRTAAPCFLCSVWKVSVPASGAFEVEVWNGETLECKGSCSLGQTCSFLASPQTPPCVVAVASDHTVDLSNAILRCPWQAGGLCPP